MDSVCQLRSALLQHYGRCRQRVSNTVHCDVTTKWRRVFKRILPEVSEVHITETSRTPILIWLICKTNPSMDALPTNRTWPPPCSHGTYQHKAITSRSRQLLMMGTWLPETCWATIRREIKNTKVLTTFLQPRHIPTQGYNITQSSTPDDGHMVARNMLSNY